MTIMDDNQPKSNNWVLEFSRYDKIEEVYIAYTQLGVQGIAFRYVDATGTKQFKNFGLMHFNFAMKLKPNEYITKLSSIIVTEPQKAIALLRIHTNLLPGGKSGRDDLLNKKKEHPKWLEKSIPVQTYEDIIVKIYGSSRSNELKKGETFLLTNIGVTVNKLKFKEAKHLEMMWDEIHENVMPVTPPPLSKHQNWSFEFDRYEYIKEISVDHKDNEVIGIGFMKVDALGTQTPIQWFGGKVGGKGNTYKITLKPNENIVQMSGTCYINNIEDYIVITSLKIHTNVWRSGYKLYGNNSAPNENSKYFSILVPSGVISEIHGTYNNTNKHISSIGICVKEPEFKEESYVMGIDTIKEEKHHEGDDAKEEHHESDNAKKEEHHEDDHAKEEEHHEGDDAKEEEHQEGDDAKKEEHHEGDDAKEEEHHESDNAKKEEHHEGDNAKKEEHHEGDDAIKEEHHEGGGAKEEEHHEGDVAKKEEHHEGDDAIKEEHHEGGGAKEEEHHEGDVAKKEEHHEGDDAIKEEHHEGGGAKEEEHHEGDVAKKEEHHEGDDAIKEEHHEGGGAKEEEHHEGDVAKKEEHHEGDDAKKEHHEGDGAKKEEEHHE